MSDPSVSDGDLRIFDRLKSALDAFDLGLTEIPVLVEAVTELLDQFVDVPPTFVEELRGIWWPATFSLALSRDQERPLSDDEEIDIRDAVALLQGRLGELGLP